MPLKFKLGEETSVIEGLRAEVPGIPPSPSPPCAAEKPWAGYFGRGKTLSGLFWPRKNLGRAIWAAEKLGRALFWHGKNNAHVRILEI